MWEYKLITFAIEESEAGVTKLGNEGWEMCGWTYNRDLKIDQFWFKRLKK